MNERKPDWYKRAQTGPFEREPFTEADMRRIEQVVQERYADEQKPTRLNRKPRTDAAVGAVRLTRTARISAAAALLLLAGGGVYTAVQISGCPPTQAVMSSPGGDAADPSKTKRVPPEGVSTFLLGGTTYFYDDSAARIPEWTRAVRTTKGIVWTPAPQMTGRAMMIRSMSVDDHPTTPFQLYFSDPNQQQLTEKNSFMLPGMPLQGQDSSRYGYIDNLWAVGGHVVYTTSMHVAGDSRREEEQAWIVDTRGLPTAPSPGTDMNVHPLTDFDSEGGHPLELAYDEANGLLIYTMRVPPEDGGTEGEEHLIAQQLDNGGKVFVEWYGSDIRTEADGSMSIDYKLDGVTHTAKRLSP